MSIESRFSAKTQQAVSEFIAACMDVNAKAEEFRKAAKSTIRRVTFNLVLSIKGDSVVMTEAEADKFMADLSEKAGKGDAAFLGTAETSQAKRILRASMADFAKAREIHKGCDLKALAEACPTVSTKGRKGKGKGKGKGETQQGETQQGETQAQAPKGETQAQAQAQAPKGETESFKAAVVVLRSRIDFLLQITGKNKGVQWQAAHASAKAASEALEALGLYPTK